MRTRPRDPILRLSPLQIKLVGEDVLPWLRTSVFIGSLADLLEPDWGRGPSGLDAFCLFGGWHGGNGLEEGCQCCFLGQGGGNGAKYDLKSLELDFDGSVLCRCRRGDLRMVDNQRGGRGSLRQ